MNYENLIPVTGIIRNIAQTPGNCCNQMVTVNTPNGINNFMLSRRQFRKECGFPYRRCLGSIILLSRRNTRRPVLYLLIFMEKETENYEKARKRNYRFERNTFHLR